MPMHDWTRVKSGTFHNFHVLWTSNITNQLNAEILPPGYFAMAEQVIGGPEPDVVTLKMSPFDADDVQETCESTVAVAPPQSKPSATYVMTADAEKYARKANRIVVRHELGEVRAIIEIVSPGNKDSRHAIRSFVEKTSELLYSGINLLIIDPIPPSARDPHGIHPLIWSEVTDQRFELPVERPLTVVSYQADPIKTAYVEPIAVRSPLPTMPLFLQGDFYVNILLEPTYADTSSALPRELKRLVE